MSMDKEELMEHLKTRVERLQAPSYADPQGYDLTQVMILRAVIALVEIRESIDDLRSSINDLGNQLEIRDTLGAKDTRSAGIG